MSSCFYSVAPFAGAWIEIHPLPVDHCLLWSHPSRVRGLKYLFQHWSHCIFHVAPFAGAWIEILSGSSFSRNASTSHPSRVRGLKSSIKILYASPFCVAPFAGAWIEIKNEKGKIQNARSHPSRVRGLKSVFSCYNIHDYISRRTLRGCVD